MRRLFLCLLLCLLCAVACAQGQVQFRDLKPLRARAQASPNMTLAVEAGECYIGNVRVSYAGGNSPAVTAPVADARIDLLSINAAGTLAWTTGTPGASPAYPTVPVNVYPLAWLYVTSASTSLVAGNDGLATHGYILGDARPIASGSPQDLRTTAAVTFGGLTINGPSLFTSADPGQNKFVVSDADTTHGYSPVWLLHQSTGDLDAGFGAGLTWAWASTNGGDPVSAYAAGALYFLRDGNAAAENTTGHWSWVVHPNSVGQAEVATLSHGGIPSFLGLAAGGMVKATAPSGALALATVGTDYGNAYAAANITDNAVVRGDGGVKGIQGSGVLIDDSNNLTVPSLTAGRVPYVSTGGLVADDDGFIYTVASEALGVRGKLSVGTLTVPTEDAEIKNATGGTLTLSRNDTSVAAGELLGALYYRSYDSSTGAAGIVAGVWGVAENTHGTSSHQTGLAFGTSGAVAENAPERWRIRYNGDWRYAQASTVYANTADGADNLSLSLAGGGAVATTRGAYFALAGNEHANAGRVDLYSGNNANIVLNAGTGQIPVTTSLFDLSGSSRFTHTSAGGNKFVVSDADTNNHHSPVWLKRLTSGDIVDGFGPGIIWGWESTNRGDPIAETAIAGLYVLRSGANNKGRWSFRTLPNTASDAEVLSVENNGDLKPAGEVYGDLHVINWRISGALAAATYLGGVPVEVPWDCTVVRANVSMKTAPDTTDCIIDINVGGSSLLSADKLKCLNGATSGTTTSFSASPKNLSAGDLLTLDIDTADGVGACVELIVRKTGAHG